MNFNNPTISANTNSVGEHVSTWLHSSIDGYTTRTKVYNKIAARFKAGVVQKKFGEAVGVRELSHLPSAKDVPPSRRPRTRMYTYRGIALRDSRQQVGQDDSQGCCSGGSQTRFAIRASGTNRGAASGTAMEKPSRTLRPLYSRGHRPRGESFVAFYAHTKTKRAQASAWHPPRQPRTRTKPGNVRYSGPRAISGFASVTSFE